MENEDQKITTYLVDKKLPLDILLEVKDHMSDQISALESEKSLSFDEAFEQIKISWEQDLKMRFSFFSNRFSKITRLQNKMMMQNQFRILRKSLILIFTIFLSTSFFILYVPELSKYVLLVIYIITAVSGVVFSIYDRKLLKTTKVNYKNNISIFQRSTGNLMLVGALFILNNNIFNFDERFLKISESIQALFIQHMFSFKSISYLITGYIFVFGVIHGYICYINYKKAVSKIKERMVLEF
ncbi:hypothetical protein BAX94_08205 [Elizabethkingia meningoseptica]|uniref:Uncharacterized protein n=1 Tax=Elizabethkingia meningoseptica TaxID=238 RepID=A0A1V3U5P3_ELIME|nr:MULTISPECIES: hypothetical protein [Elizabethkingia]AQX11587.1 hypothetical protein BBD35_03965 [Elizabethkingia meningoseptica]MBG0513020.1 hypothetical protein [Elizabethkingia meningoseptica]MDE5435543.1 hypothetical protein [Elizabethkingia meningoseptica]MDE5450011.1 hypothetical protein [Elizabethkingia meningoseptica]MDE5469045.1 hypothetical protein [Elizabethkingia meningoseptica]